ncbi:hypothetical protein DPMN_082776 [Dreissena polymorpha]|uniref:Uncharacterized protein n=1 Tax=Dreissena polymorpha TaxID=45954 RepID=A0A9D4BHS6_DREPO|nr:hypothetical protein DPMN_082776 [Dreissena polymorpha]
MYQTYLYPTTTSLQMPLRNPNQLLQPRLPRSYLKTILTQHGLGEKLRGMRASTEQSMTTVDFMISQYIDNLIRVL